jgi:hypothetical protein
MHSPVTPDTTAMLGVETTRLRSAGASDARCPSISIPPSIASDTSRPSTSTPPLGASDTRCPSVSIRLPVDLSGFTRCSQRGCPRLNRLQSHLSRLRDLRTLMAV